MSGDKGGTINRREVIAAVGALVVGEAKAEVRQESQLTAEQARIRDEGERGDGGIQALRRSAETRRNEEAGVFVVRTDGRAEWIPIRLRQQRAQVGRGENSIRMIVGSLDSEVLDRTVRLAENGAHVEYLHTHPTHVGDSRIPPSPSDFLSSLELSRRTAGARGSVSNSVVCEAGTYRYGPSSAQAGERLLSTIEQAVRPSVEALRGNRKGGRDLAEHLARVARENGTPIPREVSDMIANGRLPDALLASPPSIMGIALLESMVGSADSLSPEAASYLRNIVQARDALFQALKTIDPETDGLINMPPANGNDTSYVERWRRLGMSITFEPHPR